jgi:hypothetical protein
MNHPPEYADTDSEVMEVWLRLLRAMDPREKLAQTLHLSGMAFRMSEAGVRLSSPNASDRSRCLLKVDLLERLLSE